MAERDLSMFLDIIFKKRGELAARGGDLNELSIKVDHIQKLKERAGEWRTEAYSKAGRDRARAREVSMSEAYTPDILEHAGDHLTKTNEMLVRTARAAPAWLAPAAHPTHEASMEFVARISEVPIDLQENPDFLMREVAKLYWSTHWTSLTADAAREVRGLIFATLDEVRQIRHRALPAGAPALVPLTHDQQIEEAIHLFGEDQRDDLKRGVELYDPDSPKTTNVALRDLLSGYQELINLDPHAWRSDTKYLENIIGEIRTNTAVNHPPPPAAPAPEDDIIYYTSKIHNQIDYARSRGGRRYESDRFSNIYLEGREMDDALSDPLIVRKKMALIEKEGEVNPRAGIVEASKRRLDLTVEYMSSDRFQMDAASVENLARLGLTPGSKEAKAYLAYIREIPHIISQEMVNRENMLYAVYTLKTSGDMKRIPEVVTGIGMQGYESVKQGYGGLVDVEESVLARLYGEESTDPKTGEPKMIDAPTMKRIHERAVEELFKTKALYEEQFQQSFRIPGIDDSTGISRRLQRVHPLDREACEAIVRNAEFCRTMMLRDAVDRQDGKTPLGDFKSANITEKFLAALNPNNWHFEKWGLLGPVARHIWQRSARLAANISGRDEVANEKFRELIGLRVVNPAEYRVKVAKLCDIETEFISGIERVKDTPFTEEKKLKEIFERDPNSGKRLRTTPGTIEEISDKQLNDRLLVVEGEKAIADILKAYDPFSSGWRIKIITKVLGNVYGNKEWDDNVVDGKYMALGMRVRKEGDAVSGARTQKEREYAIEHNEVVNYKDPATGINVDVSVRRGLRPELEKVAKFRPSELMEYFSRENDVDMHQWFETQKNNGSLSVFGTIFKDATGNLVTTPQREDQLYLAIKKPLIAINEALTQKGLPPIDYSGTIAPISPEQRAQAMRVCTVMGVDGNRYLNMMQNLSSHVATRGQIDKLTSGRYLWVYTRSRFVDDARLRFLEWENMKDAEAIPIADDAQRKKFRDGVRDNETITLSKEFSENGQGPADPQVRAFGDMSVASETGMALLDSLSVDPKANLENLVKVFKNVKQYAGEPMAARALCYLAGGWLGTARTTGLNDWLFLAGGKRITSAMQEIAGYTASSLGLQEVEEVLEHLYPNIGGKLEDMDKGSFDEVEKFLKITAGSEMLQKIGLDRLPMYAYRMRLWVAVAVILIILQMGKTAEESYKEQTGDKSH